MAQSEIDWSDCPGLVADYESGVSIDEIAEQFRIPLVLLQDLLKYAEVHHTLARPLR